MSDYLSNLALRINHPERLVRPRLASLFEPSSLVQLATPPLEASGAGEDAASKPEQPSPTAAQTTRSAENAVVSSITTLDPAPRLEPTDATPGRTSKAGPAAIESSVLESALLRPANEQAIEPQPHEPAARPTLDRAAVPPSTRQSEPSPARADVVPSGDSPSQHRRPFSAATEPVSPRPTAGQDARSQQSAPESSVAAVLRDGAAGHDASSQRPASQERPLVRETIIPSKLQPSLTTPVEHAPALPALSHHDVPPQERALRPSLVGQEQALHNQHQQAALPGEETQPADRPPDWQRSVSPERTPLPIRPSPTVASQSQESPDLSSPNTAAPSVQITIGRIEVRAVTPPRERPQPLPRQVERPRPKLSLDGYLQQRRGEQ